MSKEKLRRIQDLAWKASRKCRNKLSANKVKMAEHFLNRSTNLLDIWEREQIKTFMN